MSPSRARALLWVVVLALLGGALLLALPPDATAATVRSLSIWNGTVTSQVPFKDFDSNPPKVFDIDGDGQLEIIAQNDNQWVYVFNSRTGDVLFETTTRFPSGWGARSFNGPEVAVMSQDGTTRIIVANSAAYITSFRFDSVSGNSGHMGFVKEWERRANDCFGGAGMDAKPVLADLDKDGHMEILAATEEFGLIALRGDGSLYWKNCLGGGNAEPGVSDLNLDGWPDVVHVSDGGVVAALNGRTGAWMWGYDLKSHYDLRSGSIPIGPGIGQLDGLGGPDIVVAARDSHDTVNYTNDHALLLALSSAGKELWHFQDLERGNPLSYGHPVVVDAGADGNNEVYWGDWNTIGHKGGIPVEDDWKVTGPANYYRLERDGSQTWRQTIPTYWSNKDLVLGDVDGDGVQEVLANGPGSGGDGIWYLDSRTGVKETFVSTHPWKVTRGPILADLWGTGTMQWVLSASPASNTVSGGSILVYDTHAAYSSVYPHLPYVSFGGTPSFTTTARTSTPTSPPTTPVLEGAFGAKFTIKAPNPWWQEVYISPDAPHTIASMQDRFNAGPWKTMTKSSWGAWTSSYNAPAGTQVEFLAKDTNLATSQSLPFTWMDGTLTRRSTTGDGGPTPTPTTTSTPSTSTTPTGTTAPPPTFDATFRVPPGINNWWVEVDVASAHSVVTVAAQVDGASWVGLSPTSWGTWAKSFFVVSGSHVTFRATDSLGATATSENFTWP